MTTWQSALSVGELTITLQTDAHPIHHRSIIAIGMQEIPQMRRLAITQCGGNRD